MWVLVSSSRGLVEALAHALASLLQDAVKPAIDRIVIDVPLWDEPEGPSPDATDTEAA